MSNTVPPTSISDMRTLPNGQNIPPLGLGTFSMRNDVGVKVVTYALKKGYRMLDTAELYQ